MARFGAGVLALGCMTALASAGDDVSWHRSWIGPLGLDLNLVADSFAVLMVALVCGLGALVLWYSAGYFPEHRAYGRFVGLFLIFAAAMNGLVLSADLFTMFVFWEVTSVVSFLLIGMNDESAAARASALRALLVTGAGGLCLLVGVALFQVSVGTTTFAGLVESEGTGAMFAVAAMFALVGALTKSAQFPFHFWLPGAMSAPTPVSAYLQIGRAHV
jgi:multicomponent Na+:H+ antiporter subunit A